MDKQDSKVQDIDSDVLKAIAFIGRHWGKLVSIFTFLVGIGYLGYRIGAFVTDQDYRIKMNEMINKHNQEISEIRDKHAQERLERMEKTQVNYREYQHDDYREEVIVNEK